MVSEARVEEKISLLPHSAFPPASDGVEMKIFEEIFARKGAFNALEQLEDLFRHKVL
jgi:hypothetical protein